MAPTNTEHCPNLIDHAKEPHGYIEWHDWAKRKGRTHRQIKCGGCGLYKIWVPRTRRPKESI